MSTIGSKTFQRGPLDRQGPFSSYEPTTKSDVATSIRFACERCNKSMKNNRSLKRHEKRCRGPGEMGAKSVTCDKCGLGFARRDSLRRHLKTRACKQLKSSEKSKGDGETVVGGNQSRITATTDDITPHNTDRARNQGGLSIGEGVLSPELQRPATESGYVEPAKQTAADLEPFQGLILSDAPDPSTQLSESFVREELTFHNQPTRNSIDPAYTHWNCNYDPIWDFLQYTQIVAGIEQEYPSLGTV